MDTNAANLLPDPPTFPMTSWRGVSELGTTGLSCLSGTSTSANFPTEPPVLLQALLPSDPSLQFTMLYSWGY
jgi:hypothetical protein